MKPDNLLRLVAGIVISGLVAACGVGFGFSVYSAASAGFIVAAVVGVVLRTKSITVDLLGALWIVAGGLLGAVIYTAFTFFH